MPRERKSYQSRNLSFDRLEQRQLLASDLQNPLISLDVNDDGAISAIDALVVINDLNRQSSGEAASATMVPRQAYLDVSGDGVVSPQDALQVINSLNDPKQRRNLSVSANASGLVRGHVEGFDWFSTVAKVRVDGDAPFEVVVDSQGNFAFDAGKLGALRTESSKVTIYVPDAGGAMALHQIALSLDGDRPYELSLTSSGLTEPAVRVTYDAGAVLVEGTDADDLISVDDTNGWLRINGVQLQVSTFDLEVLGVYAGDGHDTIQLEGIGNMVELHVLVDGGNGDDIITAGAGHNYLAGGDGNDVIHGSWQSTVITGGAGDDILWGNDEADEIQGDDGNDTIFANGGHDRVSGGTGDDMLYGGDGDDVMGGGDGDDSLFGEGGFDLLDGERGNDWAWGGSEGDVITGSSGEDQLRGGAGDDRIVGGDDLDRIFGEEGNDWLDGDGSGDYIYGGDGDDAIQGGGGYDHLWGEVGNDLVNGGSLDDQIVGGDGNDTLRGGSGDDVLWGGDGDDVLDGDSGDEDELHGGWGYDKFYGVSVLLGWAGYDSWEDEGGGWWRSSRSIDGDYNSLDILFLGIVAAQVNTSTVTPTSTEFAPPAVVPGYATTWDIPFESTLYVPQFPTTGGIGESIYRTLTPYLGNATVERLIHGMVPTSIGNPPLP